MFTPYNLALPTVLYPVREVPLFSHQPEPTPPHQNEFQYNMEVTSAPSPGSEKISKSTANAKNESSTRSVATSSPIGPRHGWLHLPHPHFPHSHVDLSHFHHTHVAVSSGTDTSAHAQQQAQDSSYYHLPYLPSLPIWSTHLFPAGSPLSHLHLRRHHASTASPNPESDIQCLSTQLSVHTPPASVTRLPKHYVLELDAPGLPACNSSSCGSSNTGPPPTLSDTSSADVSVTWLSPRTILVSGQTPPTKLPLDDALDGGELCRTPMREEAPDRSTRPEIAAGADRMDRENADTVKVLFSERLSGEWRRIFTLPSDAVVGVDPSGEVGGNGGLRWEVEDGVIRVWVPRL